MSLADIAPPPATPESLGLGVQVAIWMLWVASVVAIIVLDRRLRRADAASASTLGDRFGAYVAAAVLGAGLVLPVYFYATRKARGRGGVGFLLGALMMLGTGAVIFAVLQVALLFVPRTPTIRPTPPVPPSYQVAPPLSETAP